MLAITHTIEDQCLLEAADLAEAAHARGLYRQFEVGDPACGTPGCLLGNYFVVHPELRLPADADDLFDEDIVNAHFGLHGESFYELFGRFGCGNADRNGTMAAAYVRTFVEARAKARISV